MVEAFAGKDRCVSQVIAENGNKYDADLVVIGIGVTPAQELAEQADIICDNGIKVDEFCQTNVANIYALGDCSSHPSQLYGRRIRLESVPNALAQGKIAALSICGKPIAYNEVPWFWSDQYDMKLQIVGLSDGYEEVIIRETDNPRVRVAFYLKNKTLIAMDAVNASADFMVGKRLVTAQVKPDVSALKDPSFSLKNLLP